MTALRQILDEANVLGSEADERVKRERPGYIEFAARKWADVAPAAYAALAHELTHQPDQLELMRSIACPTLVVVGEQDTSFTGAADDMAAALPDSRLVVIPDAGHGPQFENPDAYFAAVDGFLRETAGSLA
jgi:3-oxoadipate enol-lactonase